MFPELPQLFSQLSRALAKATGHSPADRARRGGREIHRESLETWQLMKAYTCENSNYAEIPLAQSASGPAPNHRTATGKEFQTFPTWLLLSDSSIQTPQLSLHLSVVTPSHKPHLHLVAPPSSTLAGTQPLQPATHMALSSQLMGQIKHTVHFITHNYTHVHWSS